MTSLLGNVKKLIVSDTNELIKISGGIRDQFMGDSRVINKKGNFWIRKKVTHKLPRNCFGTPNTFNYIQVDKEEIEHSIKIVSQLLNENGLYVKDELDIDKDTNIEVHLAKTNNKKLGSGFVVHEDNNGGIDGLLHTLIVYLDIQCKGGMLEIYDDRGKNVIDTIDPKLEDVTKKMIVLFDGGLKHCPTDITDGTRLIISYQFRQKTN